VLCRCIENIGGIALQLFLSLHDQLPTTWEDVPITQAFDEARLPDSERAKRREYLADLIERCRERERAADSRSTGKGRGHGRKKWSSNKPERKFKWELARDVLNNTLVDYPEQPINPAKYPSVCTLTRWSRFREALISASIIDGETDAARRGQWREIKEALQQRDLLRIEGDLCWCPPQNRKATN